MTLEDKNQAWMSTRPGPFLQPAPNFRENSHSEGGVIVFVGGMFQVILSGWLVRAGHVIPSC